MVFVYRSVYHYHNMMDIMLLIYYKTLKLI